MDAAAASVGDDLRPAAELPVERVGEHVLEIAWPHVVPFAQGARAEPLHQTSGRRPNVLIEATRGAREHADRLGVRSPRQLAAAAPTAHRQAVTAIVRQLVRFPLALLQRTDREAPDFLYASWPQERSPARLAREQGRATPVLRWHEGAAEALIRFAPLLRPLVESALVRDVAAWNGLDTTEERLREHLFGAERAAWPQGLKEELLEVQDRRCFYDPDGPRQRPEALQIDHFLPWSRFHADGTANLVLSSRGSNASKSDLFAATRHVAAWRSGVGARVAVAGRLGLDHEADRTLALARAGYGHLPDGAPLWLARDHGGGREVERLAPAVRSRLEHLLRRPDRARGLTTAAEEPGGWSSP